MPKKAPNLIAILGALLLLVVVASAAVLWLLPAAPSDRPTRQEPVSGPPLTSPAAFNLMLFERSQYQALHLQLVSSGVLPVSPPATVGKANPFL